MTFGKKDKELSESWIAIERLDASDDVMEVNIVHFAGDDYFLLHKARASGELLIYNLVKLSSILERDVEAIMKLKV